ncbi:MAG: PD-(D/E)XK nuclease family protein [Legionellales bacterium]|nr:PD-(D/E)XK nuclease family protein [Legionellales bacterium]
MIDIDEYKPSKTSFVYPFWSYFIENSNIKNIQSTKHTQDNYIDDSLYRIKNIKNPTITNSLSLLEQSNKNINPYNIIEQITYTSIGTITHDILGLIVENNLLKTAKFNNLIARNILSKKLIHSGVPKYSLLKSVNLIRTAILNTVTDKKGNWILNPSHKCSACEIPITSSINNKIVNIIIDRTFIENRIRWIIDYKIIISKSENDINLEEIKLQYGKQLSHYAKVISLQEDLPIMLGIYLPIQKMWFEWKHNISDYPKIA